MAKSTADSLLWQLPWGHHALLLEKVKPVEERRWYIAQTLAQGWSRATLMLMIDSQAHQRQGVGASNFGVRLLAPQSELVSQALKDPYVFDFLTLEEPFRERELETGLVQHLEKFLLELGQGFAFMGRQYRVEVGEQEYFIDLLFFHVKLRCYVVIELKRGEFKPEYAGKLNFYCNVVDDQLKHPSYAPTIGLILCQRSNQVLAEYALRGLDKPIGVSTFELTRALPTVAAVGAAEHRCDRGGVERQDWRRRGAQQLGASVKLTPVVQPKFSTASGARLSPGGTTWMSFLVMGVS